jgi:single-stranded DNA-binding protein
LSQKRWETPEGKRRSKYEVIANTIQLLSRGSTNFAETKKDADPAERRS